MSQISLLYVLHQGFVGLVLGLCVWFVLTQHKPFGEPEGEEIAPNLLL